MRHLVRAAAFGVAILAGVGGAVAADVIAERKEAMKATGAALKAVRTAVEGNKATDAVAPAETIAATMKKAASLFPQGSGTGDTDALPAIWTDWAKFESAAADSAAAAEKLAMVAQVRRRRRHRRGHEGARRHLRHLPQAVPQAADLTQLSGSHGKHPCRCHSPMTGYGGGRA